MYKLSIKLDTEMGDGEYNDTQIYLFIQMRARVFKGTEHFQNWVEYFERLFGRLFSIERYCMGTTTAVLFTIIRTIECCRQ